MEVGEGAAPQNARATRRKTRCLECAVVDSVYRSYRPERAVGVCLAATWVSSWVAVGADDRGTYGAGFALGAIVAAVVAERPDSMPLAAVVNYQIVVRLADGSRVVFDEPTARTLQAGDRIVVIAGVPAAVVLSSERT
jgi:ribosomal protein S14